MRVGIGRGLRPAHPLSPALPDSSPVKGELYFVGRGLPDAPMRHVILWGATTSARPLSRSFGGLTPSVSFADSSLQEGANGCFASLSMTEGETGSGQRGLFPSALSHFAPLHRYKVRRLL